MAELECAPAAARTDLPCDFDRDDLDVAIVRIRCMTAVAVDAMENVMDSITWGDGEPDYGEMLAFALYDLRDRIEKLQADLKPKKSRGGKGQRH
jgi:hypothetical protein